MTEIILLVMDGVASLKSYIKIRKVFHWFERTARSDVENVRVTTRIPVRCRRRRRSRRRRRRRSHRTRRNHMREKARE